MNTGCCGVTESEYALERGLRKFTDITVDGSPVGRVFVPYDRVDALQQASKTGPDHEQASARIPSYAVILRMRAH